MCDRFTEPAVNGSCRPMAWFTRVGARKPPNCFVWRRFRQGKVFSWRVLARWRWLALSSSWPGRWPRRRI